jgi:3-dehydroquinate synthase
VIAVGGGVVGDLLGFAASAYMRGIDFYNIPTTLLSQIDSSIGGKTAINLGGVKNIVGAFYQPKKVLIDPDLLKTLPARQISNGLAEAVKMSLTSDAALFDIFENGNIEESIDEIIVRSLNIKKNVVEQDEKEAGLRKILNFGHTVGHGIESSSPLYHGECVALGMIPMCTPEVRERLIPLLAKCGLPTSLCDTPERDRLLCAISHDKKAQGEEICTVTIPRLGEYQLQMKAADTLADALYACFFGKEPI